MPLAEMLSVGPLLAGAAAFRRNAKRKGTGKGGAKFSSLSSSRVGSGIGSGSGGGVESIPETHSTSSPKYSGSAGGSAGSHHSSQHSSGSRDRPASGSGNKMQRSESRDSFDSSSMPPVHSRSASPPGTAPVLAPTSSTSMVLDTSVTDGLLSVVNRSIEAAEKGRESAESRMRELEGRLQEQQEQRTQLLEAEVKKLRGENTLLRGQLKVGGGASFSSAEGSDAPSGAELDLTERTAAVYAWLASIHLSQYAEGITGEGYDALEFLTSADEAEIDALIACEAVGMKPPHAKKFRKELGVLRSK